MVTRSSNFCITKEKWFYHIMNIIAKLVLMKMTKISLKDELSPKDELSTILKKTLSNRTWDIQKTPDNKPGRDLLNKFLVVYVLRKLR